MIVKYTPMPLGRRRGTSGPCCRRSPPRQRGERHRRGGQRGAGHLRARRLRGVSRGRRVHRRAAQRIGGGRSQRGQRGTNRTGLELDTAGVLGGVETPCPRYRSGRPAPRPTAASPARAERGDHASACAPLTTGPPPAAERTRTNGYLDPAVAGLGDGHRDHHHDQEPPPRAVRRLDGQPDRPTPQVAARRSASRSRPHSRRDAKIARALTAAGCTTTATSTTDASVTSGSSS